MLRLLPIFAVLIVTRALVLGAPTELNSLKAKFEETKADRSEYLDRLVELRERYVADLRNADAFAVDAEVVKYPLPPNVDGKALSALRVGKRRSPRHDYLYRSDGTWTMIPIVNGITQGHWSIVENHYFDWVPAASSWKPVYTIILLDSKYFVFAAGKDVFYEKRIN